MRTFTGEKTITAISRIAYASATAKGIFVSVGTTTGYLAPLSEESAAMNGIQYGYGFKLILEVDQDVREGDRITIDGTIYNARGVVKHDRGYNTQYIRVLLARPEKQ